MRGHFSFPPCFCSHFIFPLLLPRDTASLLTVVLLTLCCDSALSVVPAGYWSSLKARGAPGIPKAVLHLHTFSLLYPRRGFFYGAHSSINVWALPFQGLTFWLLQHPLLWPCRKSSWHICFLSKRCHEDPFCTLLLWPHSTSTFFFRGYLCFTYPE